MRKQNTHLQIISQSFAQNKVLPLPHAHPFLVQPTWQRNIFLILIRGYVELIINPVRLIYRLFITELRFRKVTILLLMFEHTCNSRVITTCVITFCVKKGITFCVGKLLHFALITLLHFALMLLLFVLVLHFAAIVITFCGDCYYILRRLLHFAA